MSVFHNDILGFINQPDWLDVGFQVRRQNDPVDALFGDERTGNLMARWQSIASEYQVPLAAQFHAFDTQAQKTIRTPVDTHNIEKGLIKVKINQTERMRELMRSGIRDDEMYDYVVNDGVRLADQVVTRSKVAKNEVLSTGKMTIDENGLDLSIDYGVKDEQTGFSLDLSEDADIFAQIETIISAARDYGVTITGMMTSRKNFAKIRRNRRVQTAINGSASAGAVVRASALNSYLADETGINQAIENDLTYGEHTGFDEAGRPTIKQKRYYPDDKVTFFAANPQGNLGVGLWGDPPEVDGAGFMRVAPSGQSPYVYVSQWMENDPAVLWTKASGLFIPVLYNPSSIWIATVEGNNLGTLTVTSAAGAADGTTKLTVSPAKAAGNTYKVKSGTNAAIVTAGQNVRTWTTWDGVSDVTANTGDKITVVECNENYQAVASGSATVTAKVS